MELAWAAKILASYTNKYLITETKGDLGRDNTTLLLSGFGTYFSYLLINSHAKVWLLQHILLGVNNRKGGVISPHLAKPRGEGSREEWMENDDGFIQVPDKHPLQWKKQICNVNLVNVYVCAER